MDLSLAKPDMQPQRHDGLHITGEAGVTIGWLIESGGFRKSIRLRLTH